MKTARERFVETWASSCGAPKAVFVGQLEAMLSEQHAGLWRLVRKLEQEAVPPEKEDFGVTVRWEPQRRTKQQIAQAIRAILEGKAE